MNKLNLGCGQYPKDGYINIDIDPASKADIIHDLNEPPYPFENGSISVITMDHLLEHMPNTLDIMRECHRLLEDGGLLIIRVPHFSRGFTHWDHKRGFDISFPLYFDSSFKGGYSGISFIQVSTKLRWFAQKWLKKDTLSPASYAVGNLLGYMFDFIGNLNLFFSSRLLCYWVGGYEEIEFTFRKPSKV